MKLTGPDLTDDQMAVRTRRGAIISLVLFLPALVAALVAASALLSFSGPPHIVAATFAAFAAEAFVAWMIVSLMCSKNTSRKSLLKLTKVRVSYVASALFAGVAFYIVLLVVGSLLPSSVSLESDTSAQFFSSSGWVGLFQLFIVAPILAPIVEEFVFRGALLSAATEVLPKAVAIILSALFFCTLHIQGFSSASDIIPVATSFVLGIISGIYAVKTKSIWPSIALHAAYNGITIIFVLALSAG